MASTHEQVVPGGEPATEGEEQAPILVDLGKRKRRQVRRLRRGKGKLMVEVEQLLSELKQAGSVAESAQPIIVLVREKRRRSGWF